MGPYRVIRFLMTLGLVSSLTACSLLLPDEEASSHPTLDSTSVPSEATVCGIVSASRLTEILNQGIHRYNYSNVVWSSDYIAYDCEIRLDAGQYEQVRVRYWPERGDLDGLLMPPVEKTDSLPNSFFTKMLQPVTPPDLWSWMVSRVRVLPFRIRVVMPVLSRGVIRMVAFSVSVLWPKSWDPATNPQTSNTLLNSHRNSSQQFWPS